MTNRQKALEALTEANLEVVHKTNEYVEQWKDNLITSDECFTKLRKLFFNEFKQEQDYEMLKVENLSKISNTKIKTVA